MIPSMCAYFHIYLRLTRWKDWEKLAVDTVRLSPSQTLALWDTFCVLKGVMSGEVPLLEFVTFLFVQTYHHAVHVSPKQSEPEGYGISTELTYTCIHAPLKYVSLHSAGVVVPFLTSFRGCLWNMNG
jgi:hypothetical protein